jgi:NADH:ubiquinone oxidoreductase subunit E
MPLDSSPRPPDPVRAEDLQVINATILHTLATLQEASAAVRGCATSDERAKALQALEQAQKALGWVVTAQP